MNDKFKFSFDNSGKSNKPVDKKEDGSSEEIQLHDTPGNARNLCLVLKDGKSIFLNYAYLISGEYSLDENMITLTFTTHTVILKGHALESLFEELTNHLPKLIKCEDERYITMKNTSKTILIEINITKN